MPQNAIIIGCDLAPIKPIPRCITFQSDITTEDCRSKIRGHLKHWKADCVLHDGAPNVGTAWVQDAFTQAELALQSMKLATEFLREGGTFVTKVFRSRDFNSLMWVFNQLFDHVDATKPPSSRNVSAEIFVVCRGYKAPKKLDPKFLDPRTVFEELPDPTPNNEAKVFKPEMKKRKRDGYEEGDHLQFKQVPVSEFIETTDPIQLLGSINQISFDHKKDDIATAAILKLPETTEEVRNCCADLKVLGKKDFRLLLKWRLQVREKFGLSVKKEDGHKKKKEATTEQTEETVVEEMDEELRIEKELQALKERESTKRKKEKRKSNEAKRKEIVRLQMNMVTPMEIGMEQQGADGDQEFFGLRKVDKLNAVNIVAKGKMNMVVEEETEKPKDFYVSEDEEISTDDEEDRLERELDGMYGFATLQSV
jgi:AdoMet-dependent rRNA methyltransferase SPB1